MTNCYKSIFDFTKDVVGKIFDFVLSADGSFQSGVIEDVIELHNDYLIGFREYNYLTEKIGATKTYVKLSGIKFLEMTDEAGLQI